MYYIPFDRLFLQLSNGIGHVMPSTDRKLELTAKASMAQPVSQTAVCSNGLKSRTTYIYIYVATSVTKFGAILFTPIMHTGEFALLWTLEGQGFLV